MDVRYIAAKAVAQPDALDVMLDDVSEDQKERNHEQQHTRGDGGRNHRGHQKKK